MGYRLVKVCTHGDFIVLPHWTPRLPASWPDIPLGHIILTLSQPVLVLSWLGSIKDHFLAHWFGSTRSRTNGFESHDIITKRETDDILNWPSHLVATSKVILGEVPTGDSTHSRLLSSVPSLGDYAAGNSSRYLTQSYYCSIESTITFPCSRSGTTYTSMLGYDDGLWESR